MANTAPNLALLTPREREVFELYGQGLGRKSIAKRLGLAPRTIDAIRMSLAAKLGFSGESITVQIALASQRLAIQKCDMSHIRPTGTCT